MTERSEPPRKPEEQKQAPPREDLAALPEMPSEPDPELADVHKVLDRLESQVQVIADQQERDQSAVLHVLERLEETQSRIESRMVLFEAAGLPETADRWKAMRQRARDLALVLAGATASAFYQTVIQEEVYPALKARLKELLASTEPESGPAEGLAPYPEPVPTPPKTPRQAAQTGTPEPHEMDRFPPTEAGSPEDDIEERRQQATQRARLGLAAIRTENYRRAIEELSRAIELDPGHAEEHCRRSLAYERHGDWQLALQDANRAVELDPSYDWAFLTRSVAYERLV